MDYVRLILTSTLLVNSLAPVAPVRATEAVGQDREANQQEGGQDKGAQKKKPGGGGGVDTWDMEGTISEDGARFVSQKDQKAWTITNPKDTKGKQGHRVRVKGDFHSATGEVY